LIASAPAVRVGIEAQELPDIATMWDLNNPAASEAKFRALLPKAVEMGNKSYHLQLITQIARTYSLRSKFDEAHELLDKVEPQLTDELVAARLRYLLERGRTYNSNQEKDTAKPLFVEAYELALKNKEDGFAVDAAHMMGIAEVPDKQMEWNLKALDVAEKSNDDKVKNWLGPLYNNIGWTYHDLGQYEEALDMFEKGLKWRKKKKDDDGIRIQTWNIGRTYRSLGKLDKALEIQKKLEKEFKKKSLIGNYFSGLNYEELGELYLLNGEGEKAKEYFGLAYTILSKDEWTVTNEPERMGRLKELSEGEGGQSQE
jgi:tetratricopeptide (TPR) repeat protein